jgi:mono/diheme cytochrome c family protein
VVEGTLTFADSDGTLHTGPNLEAGVLPVDIATNGTYVAVAFAGAGANMGSVGIYTREQVAAQAPSDCLSSGRLVEGSNVVAVAFDAKNDRLVLQRREPAELEVLSLGWTDADTKVSLGGASTFDTGHSMFHTDSGSGIACASCHPEGTDDGRVWNFSDVGERRTQPLDVGLAGTAPFHWDGELADFASLMDRIFVGRMGGPLESDERQKALEEYIYTLPRRPAARDASDAAAARGKVLFESAATGCTTCHSGPNFSNGRFGDIGKGAALQVPSLIAVSARAPYMHDGCAATLLARFDPTCGGSTHGDVSTLTSAELADLVAYLETL